MRWKRRFYGRLGRRAFWMALIWRTSMSIRRTRLVRGLLKRLGGGRVNGLDKNLRGEAIPVEDGDARLLHLCRERTLEMKVLGLPSVPAGGREHIPDHRVLSTKLKSEAGPRHL
jgi:hypothetical protein